MKKFISTQSSLDDNVQGFSLGIYGFECSGCLKPQGNFVITEAASSEERAKKTRKIME